MKQVKQELDFVYVEDNEDFIDFVGMALKKVNVQVNYEVYTDGLTAKQILTTPDKNPKLNTTKLILLDYNLPGASGIEILTHIRSLSHLKHVPVIIFSTSENPEDIQNAYNSGANAYLVKPMGMQNLTNTMQSICDFWVTKNKRCVA